MAIPLSDNIENNSNKPNFASYGPWPDVATACLNVQVAYRSPGLPVGIRPTPNDPVVEYWWPGPDFSNAGIALKVPADAQTGLPSLVAYTQAGARLDTAQDMREAVAFAGAGGRVVANRPVKSDGVLDIPTGCVIDLQENPLDLSLTVARFGNGAKIINNRLIFNGRLAPNSGCLSMEVQGGIVAARVRFILSFGVCVYNNVMVHDFGQSNTAPDRFTRGPATEGPGTVVLRNGSQFYGAYAPDPATNVVVEPLPYPVPVLTVNNAAPDETGNVNVPTSAVLTVNFAGPDADGNVNVPTGGGAGPVAGTAKGLLLEFTGNGQDPPAPPTPGQTYIVTAGRPPRPGQPAPPVVTGTFAGTAAPWVMEAASVSGLAGLWRYVLDTGVLTPLLPGAEIRRPDQPSVFIAARDTNGELEEAIRRANGGTVLAYKAAGGHSAGGSVPACDVHGFGATLTLDGLDAAGNLYRAETQLNAGGPVVLRDLTLVFTTADWRVMSYAGNPGALHLINCRLRTTAGTKLVVGTGPLDAPLRLILENCACEDLTFGTEENGVIELRGDTTGLDPQAPDGPYTEDFRSGKLVIAKLLTQGQYVDFRVPQGYVPRCIYWQEREGKEGGTLAARLNGVALAPQPLIASSSGRYTPLNWDKYCKELGFGPLDQANVFAFAYDAGEARVIVVLDRIIY